MPKVAFYTAYSWDRSLPIIRALGPLQLAGLEILQGNDWERSAIWVDQVRQADFVLVQRDFAGERQAFEQILRLARAAKVKVIFDLDDLLLELPDDHPDRAINYYVHTLVPIIQAMVEADAVTVSTQALAEYVRPYNPNVYLLSNYLDDRLWKISPPPSPAHREQVVLGFIGGNSHLPDLQMITPVLIRLFERYNDRIALKVWGMDPPKELLAYSQVEVGEFIPSYAQFAARASKRNCDIFLAPLRDNLFNRSKSWIKFLEYSSMGAPGVYSDIEPYRTVVIHGQNGFLADSLEAWENLLIQLIEDPGLRRQIALRAQRTLNQDWLLSKNAFRWAETYAQIAALADRSGNVVFLERLISQVEQLKEQSDLALRDTLWQRKEQEFLAQISEREKTIRSLLARLDERERAASQAINRVIELEGSRAYRLIRLFWRLRLALFPYGSLHARGVSVAFQSLRALRQGGIKRFPQTFKGILQNNFPRLIKKSSQVEDHPRLIWSGGETKPELTLSNRLDVIIFPVIEWDFRFQRPQQIATEFSKRGHRVFYLRTTFHNSPDVVLRKIRENIYEVHLPGTEGLNLYRDRLDDVSQGTALASFELLSREFSIHDAICLVDLPFWAPIALSLRERYGWKVIYDCMDYHRGFTTNYEQMLISEEDLSRQSDLVLASAKLLEQTQLRFNRNTLLVPNAADFETFHQKPVHLAQEVVHLHRPIIGYYGAISDWFDTYLVAELAKQRPAWNFVLIGQTFEADLMPLQELANVRLLGEKPYQELSSYLHAFDICILPFKRSPLTQATNPVKVFEYLSAGKPVVASDLEEIRQYSGLVSLASGVHEWLATIESELNNNTPEKIDARVAFASQNTWKERVDRIDQAVRLLYPEVSLILLSYKNQELTQQCLESIVEKTTYPSYEIVIVDNASPDDTPAFLQKFASQHDHCKLILNDSNRGFAGGMNQGIAASQGEILVFLNNDIVVSRGWLSRLVWHLSRDPDIGMIGAVTNATGNQARIEIGYTNLAEMEAFANQYTRAHWGQTYPLREFAMYCVAMRREVIDLIGPLDERYSIGMFEDDDYAFRVRQAGYKILCAQDAFIHHHNMSAFKTLPKEQYLEVFYENRRKFEDKWKVAWTHPTGISQPDLVRCCQELESILSSHQERKGVIIIPPTIGWEVSLFQRPHQLARAFAKHSYLVFFCETEQEFRSKAGFRQQEENLFVCWAPFEVFDLVNRPVILSYVYHTNLSAYFRKPRVIFDHIDDLSVFPYNQDQLQENYRNFLEHADIVVASADRLYEKAKEIRSDAILVPNGVDYDHFQSAFERPGEPPKELLPIIARGKPVIGYYGALAHWFDYRLVGFLAHKHPDFHFLLIGPDHDGSIHSSGLLEQATQPERSGGAQGNIFWLGSRPYSSMPQYLAWFDVAMIPFVVNDITLATSPIKLFEYLAAGKPVVTTALPECRKYFGTLVAENREEFDLRLGQALQCAADLAFRRKAQEEAARHRWTERAQQIIDMLSKIP